MKSVYFKRIYIANIIVASSALLAATYFIIPASDNPYVGFVYTSMYFFGLLMALGNIPDLFSFSGSGYLLKFLFTIGSLVANIVFILFTYSLIRHIKLKRKFTKLLIVSTILALLNILWMICWFIWLFGSVWLYF